MCNCVFSLLIFYALCNKLNVHAVNIFFILKLVLVGDFIHSIDKSFQIILILIVVIVSVSTDWTEHLFVYSFSIFIGFGLWEMFIPN